MAPKRWFWKGMEKLEARQPGSYRRFVQSYAACCTFADASVGRLIDALDRSPHRNNTMIVLWSDHGFHLGEKDHIEKFALWEKATHIPFIIVDPRCADSAGKTCAAPVDMTVIFPTLVDLCGLPANPANDGVSVAPQVRDPGRPMSRPALMTYGYKNHAVRSERWRYIRYEDGSEELYDHDRDPNEWTNLASNPNYRKVMDDLKQWLPSTNTKPWTDLKKPEKEHRP